MNQSKINFQRMDLIEKHLYLIVVIQSDCLEVLQFPQIPQFQRAILGTWSTILDKDVKVFEVNLNIYAVSSSQGYCDNVSL